MGRAAAADSGFDGGMLEQFLEPTASAPALRVALLTESGRVPRFALPLLDALARCPFVELLCGAIPAAAGGLGQAGGDALLYRLYASAVDRRSAGQNPYTYVDAGARIAELARTTLSADDTRIRSLDVVLDFTAGPVRPELGALARHGLWRFGPEAEGGDRVAAPQMAELLAGEPCALTELVQHGPEPGRRAVLAQADISMVPGPAVTPSRVAVALNSAYLPLPVLRRLHATGSAVVSAVPDRPAGRHRARGTPGNLAMAAWLTRYGTQVVGNRLFRRGRVLHWRLALRATDVPLYAGGAIALGEFRWIDSPRGHFWADPFLLARDEETWLFFEDYDYALGRAGLQAARVMADGALGEVVPVLFRPYHLSYPHVFVADGETFMVPETSDAGVVELLRATEFPLRWERVATLLQLKTVDSTLFRHAGRWWMFTSPMSVAGHAPVTLLYSAPELTGPWRLHPASPISSDVRVARGAGAVVDRGDGRLLRPSQDCAGTYGRALVFNEIRRLDLDGYEEVPVARFGAEPRSGLSGIHTYNRADRWEAIDGRFLRKRAQL